MTKRRNVRKWIWWGTGILIIAVAVIVVLVVKNNNNDINSNNGTESGEQASVEDGQKTENTEETKTGQEAAVSEKQDIPQYEGESPNTAESLTGVISYAGVSGSDLIVRVNIDQYLSGGSCKLTLTRGGTIIYSREVAIESSVSTSTCDGFKIATAELGAGNLSIEVVLESDGKHGRIVGEVKI